MAVKMRLNMKNTSQRYDINITLDLNMDTHTKYKIHAAQFMKKLSKTETELKKSVAYKKDLYIKINKRERWTS